MSLLSSKESRGFRFKIAKIKQIVFIPSRNKPLGSPQSRCSAQCTNNDPELTCNYHIQ